MAPSTAEARRGSQGGAAPRRDKGNCAPDECWCLTICIILVAGLVVLPIMAMIREEGYKDELKKPPEYTVAIAGVSGLPTSTGDVVINPEFNLTIGVASQSRLAGACILPGTSVKVSYSNGRLPLASGGAPDICAGPLESSEKRAVARGFAVAVPGFLINSLVEDVVRGEATFEVTIKSLLPDDYWMVVTCWARLVS